MSGLFGLLKGHGEPARLEELQGMDRALAAHGRGGPDRFWRRGGCGLGARMKAFTPQDAFERQPLVWGDGTLALVADIRLDNRRELLEILGGEGTLPDGALLQRAFLRWGRACVHNLTGVFAFVVLDAREGTAFAARSPILAPDLVYTVREGHFAFATLASGLHALDFVPRALDERRLASMLAALGGDGVATLHRDIRRLPTGHTLEYTPAGLRTGAYWRPDLGRTLRFADDRTCFEAFTDLFGRVVEDQLRSATPVALQLSGGLDSAAVAAMACPLLERAGQRLVTFTEVPSRPLTQPLPPGRYGDETPLVRLLGERYGNLEINRISAPGRTFLDGLEEGFACCGEPLRATSNRVWMEAIQGEAGNRGLGVLLDGMQGNITMSWAGGGTLPGLLAAGRLGEAWRRAKEWTACQGGSSPWRVLLAQGILPLLPDALWLAQERLRKSEGRRSRGSVIHPAYALRMGLKNTYALQALAFRPGRDPRRVRHRALCIQDSGAILSGCRARFGVDMRSPAADVRIAEFAMALPEEQFLGDGESRRLIRRAMAGALPPAITANRQRGQQAADWLTRLQENRKRVAEELERFRQSELVRERLDLPRLEGILRSLPAGPFQGVNPGDFLDLQFGVTMGRFLEWFGNGAGR